MLAHIKDHRNQWTVVVDNKSYQFDASHPEYVKLVKLVSDGDSVEFVKTLSVGTVIQDWSDGLFRFTGGILFYGQESVHEVITGRIIQMIKDGVNHKPVLKFLENLYKNPSYRAINELYSFLANKALPITDDGCFLGYKSVIVYHGVDIVGLDGNSIKEGDLVDKYTCKSYRNNVGDNPQMPRFKVDDNCERHCSDGLHVGAIPYVKSYVGDKIMLVKVNPANVVSVPTDANCQKVRVCAYDVIGEYEGDLNDSYDSRYAPIEDEDDEDDWDDLEDDLDDGKDYEDDSDCCDDEDCDICYPSDNYGGNTPIVDYQTVIDARNYPPLPAGYEVYTPKIGEPYAEDTIIWTRAGDFSWSYFFGETCQNPEYDRFTYAKPSVDIHSLYE